MQIYDRLLNLPPIAWDKKAANQLLKPAQNMATQIREYKSVQRVPGTQPSHALADYTGVYSHPAYGELEVLQRDEGLCARFHGRELNRGFGYRADRLCQEPGRSGRGGYGRD